jgi:hypothetical protein
MALTVAARAFAAGFPGTLSARRIMIVVAGPSYEREIYHDHEDRLGAKIKPAC